ncbi:hypothetical protein FH972_022994 [Carpinus fangiana]|uniref:Uncharacterized protein n=1 Tax=Carpinus fangiana TaxID=176857 RepID=A0A5N6KU69_9ROSI|nr:hypothetical protein FH972_022994 [Carpinus fangiana]
MSDDGTQSQLNSRFNQGSTASSAVLPTPSLKLDFRMSVKLNPLISVGKTVWGQRNWISFSSGEWSALWGRGTVVQGGQDNQLVTEELSTFLETNYLLKTDDTDPAYITVKTTGWRTGDKETLQKLLDPQLANEVSPHDYKFRLYVRMESGDARYSFVNTSMWIASAARYGSEGKLFAQSQSLWY